MLTAVMKDQRVGAVECLPDKAATHRDQVHTKQCPKQNYSIETER